MKATFNAVIVAALLAAAPVRAQDDLKGMEAKPTDRQACNVPADLLKPGDGVLEKVAAAVKASKKLDVLVVGSGSSALASSDGASAAYPARLEASLRDKLPGVAVSVTTNLQPKRTAEEVAQTLQALVTEHKLELLIWQTGTVDAMRAISPDDFRSAIDEGVGAIKAAGADVILMNLQYSPRMETMLATSPYLDGIRAVAQLYDAPLFDRYAIMHSWSKSGEFDLSNASRSYALARSVHDCLGRALASLVIVAAKLNAVEPKVLH